MSSNRQHSFAREFISIFNRKDLIYSLAVKDFKVRYRSAALGFLWMLLNPLLQMIVLSIVFSYIVKIHVNGPYPIFLLCGLLPWNFMSMSLNVGASSLVSERNLVKKVYFPREIIPISVTMGHFINFCVALLLFLPVPVLFMKTWSAALLFLPIPIFLLLMFTVSITALATIGDTFYRDTRFIVEALVMVWFYASPIFYPLSFLDTMAEKIPAAVQPLLKLFKYNPMAGIINMFRSILLKGQIPSLNDIVYVACVTTVMAIICFLLYRRYGPVIADHM